MARVNIVEEQPLNIVEVKDMLKKIKKRDEELNFRAQKTEEYLQAINTIKPKEAKELAEKLEGLKISRVKEQHIHKVIDVMPQTPAGVKTLFAAFTISLTAENAKKVAELVKEYAPKKK